jgi:hypothetical protein
MPHSDTKYKGFLAAEDISQYQGYNSCKKYIRTKL